MKVIVCGSRHLTARHADAIASRLATLPDDAHVLHGAAPGADSIAASWASAHGHPVQPFPARWSVYGPSAGPRRNQAMLEAHPDLVIAFHTDPALGKGTAHMVRIARAAGVPVDVVLLTA